LNRFFEIRIMIIVFTKLMELGFLWSYNEIGQIINITYIEQTSQSFVLFSVYFTVRIKTIDQSVSKYWNLRSTIKSDMAFNFVSLPLETRENVFLVLSKIHGMSHEWCQNI
jgi:hypothetical protein